MAQISGHSAAPIVDHGKPTPVGVRDHPKLTHEEPPARDSSRKVTAAEARGQAKHGIGLATDHEGFLTGVEGRTFDEDLRPPLSYLRVQHNAGHVSAEDYAKGVAS